ncbi:amidase [Actinomadura sp. NBRC 104412]|uniref:amidase n=1 Tax=Actinomadura sp. NBRC 104412 TaxID=3032203 RepID=UPI0024A58085|nr:amidase [Actinomadura sp. NBRC 104412]GLZ02929.1 amidase [Actinomadura sp. NBRC 104412]
MTRETTPVTTATEENPVALADEGPARRRFLAYMGSLTAAAAAGTAVVAASTGPAHADPNPKPLTGPLPGAEDAKLGSDLTELTVAEAATLIRARKLSPVDLVDAYLARIEKHEPTYQAFNTVLADAARKRARELAKEPAHNALHGIPLGIKDNYYTQGVKTTANSLLFKDFVPDYDATCVARLKANGGIVLGKTQMGPLATTRATDPFGVVTSVNAWTPDDPRTNPGGSSTGSATAVAGRLVTSSIGTQTGGSITNPSNAQNLTGLKPTLGRCSVYGVIPLTYTRDHTGPLARDAVDAAIMLQALAGADPHDPRTGGVPRPPDYLRATRVERRGGRVKPPFALRLGVLPGYTSGTSATARARAAMLDEMANAGVRIKEVSLPDEWDFLTGSSITTASAAERCETFMEFLRRDVRGFGVSLNSWLRSLFVPGHDYVTWLRLRMLLLEKILFELFRDVNLVVQTSVTPFDLVGCPLIGFPIGFSQNADGLDVPIGALVGGLPYGEERLLGLAATYQATTDWHKRRPPEPSAASARIAAARRPRVTAEEVVAAGLL